MKWKQKVERWRNIVQDELSKSEIPLPVDLVLAVIHVESRGFPGTTNPKSGASGLMQVMPATLEWYNKQTGDSIPLWKLRNKNFPTEQIRTGIWVLGRFWKSAYSYLRDRLEEIPVVELAKIADLFYVAGPGATKKRLKKIKIPFLSHVKARFPNWNALPHPENVWKVLPDEVDWDLSALSTWLEGAITRSIQSKKTALVIIAVIIIAYWWYIRHIFNKN